MGRRGQREVGETKKTAEGEAERMLMGQSGGQCLRSGSVSGLPDSMGSLDLDPDLEGQK